jgi:outer membrane protein assembly factor BamE (lipoprotein component of BamABCDE complex)
MILILRAIVTAALATLIVPAVAAAQNASADSLVRRIAVLERTTLELQSRVRDLEALIKSEPSRDRSVQSSIKWRDLQNWRRLRRGMSMDEVRTLLGEPGRVVSYGAVGTIWHWDSGGAEVRFDGSSEKLAAWSEPSS